MGLNVVRNDDTNRWEITDSDTGELVTELSDRRGRSFGFRDGDEIRAVVADEDGGFIVVTERSGRLSTLWERYDFGEDGRMEGRSSTSLNLLQALALEDELDVDLNGDGEIGFAVVGSEALNRNGDAVEVYQLAAGALGIVTDKGEESEQAVPLLTWRGNALWTPARDAEVVAVREDGDGWRIITEELIRGTLTYREYQVASDGSVGRRSTTLSEFDVIALETDYGGNINGETKDDEDVVDFTTTSETRIDRGAGEYSVWEISGGGYGVVYVAPDNGDGAEEVQTLFVLRNADGSEFLPGDNSLDQQSIVAVRRLEEAEGGGFRIVLEAVRPLSTMYIELEVSEDGTVNRRGDTLRGDALFNAEVDYRTDINNDGIITVPSGRVFELRLDPEANVPLNFSGSQGDIFLDAEEFDGNTLTLLGDGAVEVKNFSGTLNATGMSAELTVEAVGETTIEAQATAGDIELTGSGDVTVNGLSTRLDASDSSGELVVNTVSESNAVVETGSGPATVNSGDNNATVNATQLSDNTLTVTGTGAVFVTELGEDVDASGFSGTLDVTTKENAELTVTTGSGNTIVMSNGTRTITVVGEALESSSLTLNGSSAFTSTDLSGTTVVHAGSGALNLTPLGALTLNLADSTGNVTVDTDNQGAGILTVTGTPATGPTITGNGKVTVNVDAANTNLQNISDTTDLTVAITGDGTTSLTAAQASNATVTGPAGSFAITAAAAETEYDFSEVGVADTSLTFVSGGTLATTQFGTINELIVSGDHTVTMTAPQAIGKKLVAEGDNRIVFDLAAGNNFDTAVPTANMPANYDLALQGNATVTMRVAQHEGAGTVSGSGDERIILADGGTVNAREEIESYQQDGAELTVVVSESNTGVNVFGNDNDTTVNVGALTVTGVYELGGGANRLILEDGADITAVKSSDGANPGANQIAGAMTISGMVRMTTAQHVTDVTATGNDDRIILTAGGGTDTVTAAAAIETYELASNGLRLNLDGSNRSTHVVGSADTGTIGLCSNAWTGTFELKEGYTLDLTSGANIAGVNDGANTTAGTIRFSGSVTMTAAQHNAVGTLTATGSNDTIVVRKGQDSEVTEFTARAGVETYVLGESDLTVTITDDNAAVNINGSTGSDTVIIGENVTATGSLTLSNGEDVVRLSNGADIKAAEITGSHTLELVAGARATMTTAQHEAAFQSRGITADLNNTIVFSDAANATARAATNYELANGNQTFTLANATQTVTTGTGDVTVSTGVVTSFTNASVTGTGTGTGSDTTLLVASNADISGLGLTDVNRINLADNVNATVTLTQNSLIDAAAGTNTVTLSEAGAATGAAQVDSYILAEGDQTFTLGAVTQNVQATGGTVTLSTGELTAYSGTVTGGVAKLLVPTGVVDLRALDLTHIGEVEVAGDATVRLTGVQADDYTVTGAGDVIGEGVTGTTDLSGLNVGGNVTVKTTGSVDARGVGDLTTVDTFELQDGSLEVNAAQLGTEVAFVGGDATVTVAGDIGAAEYSFAEGGTNTLVLEHGADISGATFDNLTQIQVAEDATVTMSPAQHGAEGHENITGASDSTIIFSDVAGTEGAYLQGAATIGAYQLGGEANQANFFNLGAADQQVTGGPANDTVWVGEFRPGTIDLDAGSNVLGVQRGYSIVPAGDSLATGGSYSINVLFEGDAVTMTRAQHDDATAITRDGSALVIAIHDGGPLTAKENVTEYRLSDSGNTLALTNETTGVNVTGGNGNDIVDIGGRTVSGLYVLGEGNNALRLTNGADIANATLQVDHAQTLTAELSGSVTMSEADYNAFTGFTGASATVTLTTGGAITTVAEITTYNLSNNGTTVTLGTDTAVTINGGTSRDIVDVGGLTLSGGNFQLNGGANVVRLGDGADVEKATIGGTFGFEITEDASVTMGTGQHNGADIIMASGDRRPGDIAIIMLVGTDAVVGALDVKAYSFAGLDFTLERPDQDITVTGGSGKIVIKEDRKASGQFVFKADSGSDYTLVLEPGAGIAGVNAGAAIGAASLSFEGTVDMTVAQHQDFGAANITGAATPEIVLSALGGVTQITGAESVGAYTLADGDQTFTLGDDGQSVTTGSGNVTVEIDGRTATGTFDGRAAGTFTLDVTGTTDLTDATLIDVDEITVAEDATLRLTAAQAGGLTVTGTGSVIVEGFVENTDLSEFDKDLSIHATVTAFKQDLRNNESVDRLASLQLTEPNDAGNDPLLTGAQASGLEVTGPNNYAIWLENIPPDADLSGVSENIFVRVGLTEDVVLSSDAKVSQGRFYLYGQTLTIPAELLAVEDGPPTVAARGPNFFHQDFMTWVNSEQPGSKVVVAGVENDTDLTTFLELTDQNTLRGTLDVTARIDADDPVDLTGNGTLGFVTAYEVEADAMLTLNAADADGRDGSGGGSITIAALDGSGAHISDITPDGGVTLALGDADATLGGSFTFAGVSYTVTADGARTFDITAAGSLPEDTAFEVEEDVTLRLTAEQADGLSVTGNGKVIVEGVTVATADLSSIEVDRLEVHLDYSSEAVDLRANDKLGNVDKYQLAGTGSLSFVLSGEQAAGVEIALASGSTHEVLLIGLEPDGDYSNISARSIYAILDEDVDVSGATLWTDLNRELGSGVFLGGKELTIGAEQLQSGFVRFQGGAESYFWYSLFNPGDDSEGSVVVTGVKDGTDLSFFINGSFGRPPVTARIDTDDDVDLTGNSNLGDVTAYEVEADATLTLNAADADGCDGSGGGSITIAALDGSGAHISDITPDGGVTLALGDADATLGASFAFAGVSYTVTADGERTFDITAAGSLPEDTAFVVEEDVTLRLTAEQADGLTVTGAGNVIVTALGGSEADLPGITVSGDVSLDAGNPDPVLGEGFTFGARDYDVIGAGTLDVSQVSQDLSLVTSFDVADNSLLAATAGQVAQIGIGKITGDGTLRKVADENGSILDGSGAGVASVILVGGAGADTFVFGDGVAVANFDEGNDRIDVSDFAAPVSIEQLDLTTTATGSLSPEGVYSADASQGASWSATRFYYTVNGTVPVAGDYQFQLRYDVQNGFSLASLGHSGDSANLRSLYSPSGVIFEGAHTFNGLSPGDTFQFNFRADRTGMQGFVVELRLELTDGPNAPLALQDVTVTDLVGSDTELELPGGETLRLLGNAANDVQDDWFIFA